MFVGLSDIIPVARAVCDAIIDVTLRHALSDKRRISCRKGCSTCCSYLVPLSVAEVYRLQNEFLQMPDTHRMPVLKSYIEAAKKILNGKAQKILQNSDDLQKISDWYAGLGIQCPFLSNGICSIYEMRPLACREYYVSSRPERCKNNSTHDPNIVHLPVSILESIGTLVQRLEQSQVEAVILPMALVDIDEFCTRSKKTWPAVQMINLFLDIIEENAAQHAQAQPIRI